MNVLHDSVQGPQGGRVPNPSSPATASRIRPIPGQLPAPRGSCAKRKSFGSVRGSKRVSLVQGQEVAGVGVVRVVMLLLLLLLLPGDTREGGRAQLQLCASTATAAAGAVGGDGGTDGGVECRGVLARAVAGWGGRGAAGARDIHHVRPRPAPPLIHGGGARGRSRALVLHFPLHGVKNH